MGEIAKAPQWLFDIPKPRALLVIAHSDDETIFAGGLILSSRDTQWTIVNCFDGGDQTRRHEFLCACEFLAQNSGNHIEPVFLDPLQHSDHSIDCLSLAKALEPYAVGYDIVFTHNRQGEYGHQEHKLVHRCVIESINNPNTWFFISPGSTNVNQDDLRSKRDDGNKEVNLIPEILELKKRTFSECHVSQAKIYGYDGVSGKLRNTDLKETLSWYFEDPGKEEYTFYQ